MIFLHPWALADVCCCLATFPWFHGGKWYFFPSVMAHRPEEVSYSAQGDNTFGGRLRRFCVSVQLAKFFPCFCFLVIFLHSFTGMKICHSKRFASFFYLWPSLQSKSCKHLLYFSNILEDPIFFFLSQSLWAVNRASAGNNTLVGKRRFTSSGIRQQLEIKLRCLLRSLHQNDFAQSFQENSSAHTPTMPGRALLCWALSGFLQQPGLNFHGIFSFKETRKNRDTFSFCQNLHWWQGELICLEITATSQCGGMKRKQTFLRRISLSPWHARSYSSCWGYRGEGGQGQDLSTYSKWVRKVLIDSNKDKATWNWVRARSSFSPQ